MPTTSRSRAGSTTAVATRPPEQQLPAEQQQSQPVHPLVAAIDQRMPAIAEMLPDGMDAKRFRRVVVQALTRNPQLLSCDPLTVITSITEAAEAGLEPTGVLGRAWLIPYGREAKLVIGYRGYAELAWRADRVLLSVDVVREGDDFSYQRGTGAFLHHTPSDDPDREVDDRNITHAYCLATFPDGRQDFEVMSLAALERIRDRAKKKNPVWDSDFGEMAKKTPLRRLLKRLPLSAEVRRFLAADEAIDFDTPVERVAADQVRQLPAGAARGEQAASRAAALRQEAPPPEPQAEPEPESEPEPALDIDQVPFDSGAADANDDEASHADVVAAAPGTSAPEADQPVGQDQVPPTAPVSEADACDHPSSERVVREAGVVCTICGSILASYGGRPSAPTDPKPARLPGSREAVMARLHVSRTHEEVRAIAAAVLGLDPEKPWSMTDLFDEDLAQVLAAVRNQDQQRTTHAARPRREPAAAGGRRRS